MQRQLIVPIEILDILDLTAELDLKNPDRMQAINCINEIILTINHSHLLKRIPLNIELKNLAGAKRQDITYMKEVVRLQQALVDIGRREKLIEMLESPADKRKLLSILTKSNKPIDEIQNLFINFSRYSKYSHFFANELAIVAYLIDKLIFSINCELKEFKSDEIKASIKRLLMDLYTSRSEIALCMEMHIKAYEQSAGKNNDILLPIAATLNKICGKEIIKTNNSDTNDNSFPKKVKNQLGDEDKELPITVQQYFEKYCQIETESCPQEEKVKKMLEAVRPPRKRTWISLIPIVGVGIDEHANNVLRVPIQVVEMLAYPVIDLVRPAGIVITDAADIFKKIIIDPQKRLAEDFADMVVTGAGSVVDGIAEALISKPLEKPMAAKPIAKPNLAPDVVPPAIISAPLSLVTYDERLKNEMMSVKTNLKKEMNFWGCFCCMFKNKVEIKKQKKKAISTVFKAKTTEEALENINKYLANEKICDKKSRTKDLMEKVKLSLQGR